MIGLFTKYKIEKTQKRIAFVLKQMVSDRVLGTELYYLCNELRILELKLRKLRQH